MSRQQTYKSFVRTPVDCEMCREVDRIEEMDVDSLSVEQFEER